MGFFSAIADGIRTVAEKVVDGVERAAEFVGDTFRNVRDALRGNNNRSNAAERHRRRLRNLNSELEDLERKNEQRLQETSREFENKLKNQRSNFEERTERLRTENRHNREEMQTNLEQQRNELLTRMSEQRSELENIVQQETAKLENYINNIEQKFNQKWKNEAQLAKKWLENFENKLKTLKLTYDYQKFAPERVAQLEERLGFARKNLADQAYQASLVISQEQYLKAEELNQELELLIVEWEVLLEEALDNLQALQVTSQKISTYEVDIFNMAGEEIKHEIEVDFWSKERLSKRRAEIKDYEQELNDEANLTTEDLVEINSQLQELRGGLEVCIEKAEMNFLNYIRRLDIQELIAQNLSEKGFHPVDHFNEEDDERKSNTLIMKNKPGERIITTMSFDDEVVESNFNIIFDTDDQDLADKRLENLRLAIEDKMGEKLVFPERKEDRLKAVSEEQVKKEFKDYKLNS